MADLRPDPLALPWETSPPEVTIPPDLSVCCKMLTASTHCRTPPEVIIWVGCEHEHVGPVAACEPHGAELIDAPRPLTCGLCGYQTRIIKTEPAAPVPFPGAGR